MRILAGGRVLFLGQQQCPEFQCPQEALPEQFKILLCLVDGAERRRQIQAKLNPYPACQCGSGLPRRAADAYCDNTAARPKVAKAQQGLRTNEERIMDERTRRALFSVLAMQGILASQKEVNPKDQTRPGEVAQWARAYADALIAELTREQVAGGQ